MVDVQIDVNGVEEIKAKLDRLQDVGAVIGPALMQSGAELRTWVSEYPPATAANQPNASGRYYVRGTGQVYVTKSGPHVVKASEMLNRRWSTTQTITPTEATVKIGNSASYAPYVHDARKQARFHGARGWRTVQTAIEQFRGRIIRRVEEALARALK